MADRGTIRVGHISALTWNQLKINEAIVPGLPELNRQMPAGLQALPEGVSCRSMTAAEAAAWLETHAPGQEAEKFVAGKVPIYHPQKFGTGLGAEYEQFLTDSDVRTDLIEAAAGARPERPLLCRLDYQDGDCGASARILHLGEKAALTMIIDCTSGREAAGLAAVSTRAVLERGAHLTLVCAQTLGRRFLHLGDLGVSQADDARIDLVWLDFGAKDSFAGLQIEQIGRRAAVNGAMGYLVRDEESVDINYNVIQRGRQTDSSFDFDGVLDGQGRKAFRGTIDFRNGCCGSKGKEMERILLLSPDTVNRTLPIILCEEEDVEGAHGASIGRLNEDMLFYMGARGIDEKTARDIMVRARLRAVIRRIPDQDLQEKLYRFVEEAFADESLS